MATLRTTPAPAEIVLDLDDSCPGCGDDATIQFLGLADVPVFNNVLFADPGDARSAATGDVRLVACTRCGLIANTAFVPSAVAYGPDYENSLHGSATFSSWAEALAQRLADRYLSEGGTVVEVGAGSGEFLALVCEASGCTGTGWDPSHREDDDRSGSSLTDVRVERSDDPLAADLVVCRHVLEHVPDPVAFLREVREAVVPRSGRLPIYVEVPDAAHMIRRDAVWDVIYEHPLYFDEGTLARTLAAAGYEPIRTGTTFGGQFAWIEAWTDRSPRAAPAPPSRQELIESCAGFGRRFAARIAELGEEILRASRDGDVVVWGAGSKGVTFCNLVPGADAAIVVDVSSRKRGRYLPVTAQQVVGPHELRDLTVSLVVVMNAVYSDEISDMLRTVGVRAPMVVA
ncbi:class I SAM-dependent methyltransferase [Euzebya rosea]|uniref:class I SAM-dependent methyltransferase n=1 Tax=Euzebya rosea TaxID=2052804 RepID=UPI000D3E2E5E|nr:class I SAM-dependent methyltransferase [Euzebya rosea]